MAWIATWRRRARMLKRELLALYLAYRDPRTPWPARILTATVVAYAFSPIDLVPDFIPVLGHIDDLILVPLGVALALRLIPPAVMADCREQAQGAAARPVSRAAAIAIIALWLSLAGLGIWIVARVWLGA